MSDRNYWKNFWNKNNIIQRDGVHEKVGRTIKGVAIDNNRWDLTLNTIETYLLLNADDDVLDIAAGSGAVAIPFSSKVRSYTALDISEKLLEGLKNTSKITVQHADIVTADIGVDKYTKVILYFALQHFNEKETLDILEKIYKCLKPGGICLIGDIPDIERKFEFFNTPEREKAYFSSIKNNEPIIGTWFERNFLKKAGLFLGFSESILLDQPVNHINSHYRFDLKLVK